MRKIGILIILSLLLTGCSSNNEQVEYVNEDLWNEIVNQEYSARNGWAGEGLYFYEKDDSLYCDYLIYGSGVRVAGLIPLEVTFTSEGNLVLMMPYFLYIHDLNHVSNQIVFVTLQYDNGAFLWDDLIFEDIDLNFHPVFYEE